MFFSDKKTVPLLFSWCVESLVVPADVTEISIDSLRYEYSRRLKEILFENDSKLEKISMKALKSTKIKSIDLPPTVKIIEDDAFPETLEQITFNGKIHKIGYHCFNWTKIKKIHIDFDDSTDFIDSSIFGYCPELEEITTNKKLKMHDLHDFPKL